MSNEEARAHQRWMKKALALAVRGEGMVSPNPLVGAVIVKNGRQIASGFHAVYGGAHAEVAVLRKAGFRARGADLYVTLEPCAHWGKTPPCTDAIRDAGIRRVIIAQKDPHPHTAGRGLRILRREGVGLVTGVLRSEAEALNRSFKKWATRRVPYVTLKAAQSLDGRIATFRGESQWITSDAARRAGRRLRALADAVLVGAGTVKADDPRLDARLPGRRTPLKVVLDSRLGLSPRSRLFRSRGPVLVATTRRASRLRLKRIERLAEVTVLPAKNGRVELRSLLKKLAHRGVARLLVEGGGETLASFVEEGYADEAYFFIAPRIIGGRQALPSVAGRGAAFLKKTPFLKNAVCRRVGPDFLIHGYF